MIQIKIQIFILQDFRSTKLVGDLHWNMIWPNYGKYATDN